MGDIGGHVLTNQEDPCANQSEENVKNWAGNSENWKEKTLSTAFFSDNQEGQCENTDEAMSAEAMNCDLEFNPSNGVIEETANSNNYSGSNDDCSESLTDLQGFNSGGDNKNDIDSSSEDSSTDSEDSEADSEDTDTDSQDTDTETDNQNSENDTDTDTDSDKIDLTKINSGVEPNQNLIFRGNVDESEDSDEANIAEAHNASNGSKVPRKRKKKESTWLSEKCLEIPDISSLELNDKDLFQHFGKVHHILKEDAVLVCVEPLPNMPAYDLNTIFFLDEGKKVLGYPWDVMGQVKSPTYVFKLDVELIENLSIEKDAKVYCVPNSKYTSLVPIDELMKARGSDASWIDDAEVPTEFADFSADEEEHQCKKSSSKSTKRKHKQFEKAMYPQNLIKTQHHDSKSHNSDKARIIPSRQMSSRFPTGENFHPRSNLHHMNHTSARTAFPSPQWQPSVYQQWTPGVPQQSLFNNSQLLRCTSTADNYVQFASQQFLTPPPQLYNMPVGIPPPGPSGHVQFLHLFDPSIPPPNYGGGKR